jgi:hypothetical protein
MSRDRSKARVAGVSAVSPRTSEHRRPGTSLPPGLLWVIDSSLPLAVSIDDDRTVHEYVLTGGIGISRRIGATLDGY